MARLHPRLPLVRETDMQPTLRRRLFRLLRHVGVGFFPPLRSLASSENASTIERHGQRRFVLRDMSLLLEICE